MMLASSNSKMVGERRLDVNYTRCYDDDEGEYDVGYDDDRSDLESISTASKLVNITTTTISSTEYGSERRNSFLLDKMDPPASYHRQKNSITTITENATVHVRLVRIIGVGNSNKAVLPRTQRQQCQVSFASSTALSMQVGSSRLCPYTGLLVVGADQQKIAKKPKKKSISHNPVRFTNEFYWSTAASTKHLSVVFPNDNQAPAAPLRTIVTNPANNRRQFTADGDTRNNRPGIVEITVIISKNEGINNDVAHGLAFLDVNDSNGQSYRGENGRSCQSYDLNVQSLNAESAKYFGPDTLLTVSIMRDDHISVDSDSSEKLYPQSPSYVSSHQKLRSPAAKTKESSINVSQGTATTVKEEDDETYISFTKSMLDNHVRPLLQKLSANEMEAQQFQRSCSEHQRNSKKGMYAHDGDVAANLQKTKAPISFTNLKERFRYNGNAETQPGVGSPNCSVSMRSSWEQLRYVVTRCTNPTNRQPFRSTTYFDDGIVLPPQQRRRSYYNFNDNDTMLSTIATRESWGA